VFDAKISVVLANTLFVAEITDETVDDVTNIRVSLLQTVIRIDLSFKQLHAL